MKFIETNQYCKTKQCWHNLGLLCSLCKYTSSNWRQMQLSLRLITKHKTIGSCFLLKFSFEEFSIFKRNLTYSTISFSSLMSLSRDPVLSSNWRCNAGENDCPTSRRPGILQKATTLNQTQDYKYHWKKTRGGGC